MTNQPSLFDFLELIGDVHDATGVAPVGADGPVTGETEEEQFELPLSDREPEEQEDSGASDTSTGRESTYGGL